MIYTETVVIRGKSFVRTYSDKYCVVRDGLEYCEAIDPIDSGRSYTESNTLLDSELTETEEKAKAYDVLMGVQK